MKKFEISKNCNACGLCTTMTDLLTEDSKGFARPVEGKFISDAFAEEAEKIAAQCPASAISVVEGSSVRATGKQGLTELIEVLEKKLRSIGDLKPDRSSFDFDAKKYKADATFPTGAIKNLDGEEYYHYFYSSPGSAKGAARDMFNQMYANLDSIISAPLSQYKSEALVKYYSTDEFSIYSEFNKKYVEILKETAGEARLMSDNKISLPDDFDRFDVVAHNGEESFFKILKTFEIYVLEDVKKDFDHSESSYTQYFTTDSEKRYVGDGLFGRAKYETRYSYSSDELAEACSDFLNDINYCLQINASDVASRAFSAANGFIENYNWLAKKEAERKIEQFRQAVNRIR